MTDKNIAVIEKKVHPIAALAEKLEIDSPEKLHDATILLSKMNKAHDLIIEEKDKVYKPAYATVVAIRKQWKPLEDLFDGAIEKLRRKMTVYQTEAKRVADEKAQKVAERIGSGKGKLSVETGIRKLSEIETPDKEIATDEGLVQFRDVKRYRVVDEKKIPREYLMLDESKVKLTMKEGKEIAGIEYYTEQVPANYR